MKNLQNHIVSRRFHNKTKPQETFNCALISLLFLKYSPAGWDNEKKIAILYENMHSIRPDQYYTDVIAKPMVRKSTNNRDVETSAEDEQQFLTRQQQYLQVQRSKKTTAEP